MVLVILIKILEDGILQT